MLSFLQSYFLYGLFAVSLPILIHLLNRRKATRVQFSTLFFLRELQKKQMRRLKLRQIILLLLRALVIAMAVFAFARPTMRSNALFLGKANVRTAAAIVLDNSMSMRWEGPTGTRYSSAIRSINFILNQLNQGDQISLFVPCPIGDLSSEQTFESKDAIQNLLINSNPSMLYGDMLQTLNQAAAHLNNSIFPNKEMYILSDFQKSSWTLDNVTETSLNGSDIRYFTLDLNDVEDRNSGFNKVGLKEQIIELSKPVSVVAEVGNYSNRDAKDLMVHAFLMNNRVGQNTIDIQENRSETISFNLTLKQTGFISGMVELEDDPLLEDNRGYLTFYLHDKISILLLGDTEEVDYLKLALAPNPDQNQLFDFTESNQLLNLDTPLSQFPVLILADASILSESDVAKISQYVQGGGHLMFFPGGQTDIRSMNERFLSPLGLPLFTGSTGTLGKVDSYIGWGSIDFNHPIFSNVFRGKVDNIESPQFYFRLNLEPQSGGMDVIKYNDNASFLHVTNVEKGSVFLFTSGLDPEWNNFIYKSIFPPLIYRSVIYLASQGQQQASSSTVGEEIQSEVYDPGMAYSIIRPDGVEEKITPKQSGISLQISYTNTKIPGIYKLLQGESVIKQWAVNVDPKESGYEKTAINELDSFLGGQTTSLSLSSGFEEQINENRFGSEFTKWFFVFAILFLVLEMLISREDLLAYIPGLNKLLKEGE